MEKKATSGIMLTLLLLSILTLALNIQTVRGWTGGVIIRADGSIDPPDARISSVENTTYIFADSIFGSIVVEKNDIVIDGAGYTLQGTGRGRTGIELAERTNVTVQNTQIKNFTSGIGLRDSSGISIIGNNITANSDFGIHLAGSSSNIIIGNSITHNYYGIDLSEGLAGSSSSNNSIIGNTISNSFEGIMGAHFSDYNNVSRNTVTNCDFGIVFNDGSSGNSVIGNIITDNGGGVAISYSSNNVISDNSIAANTRGIYLHYSSSNVINGNNITRNDEGIWLRSSYNNKFHHNYFIYNLQQVGVEIAGFSNVWDNGYSSGGNYWSDYAGMDENKDGFGDEPYIIDAKNADHYPLMISPPIIDIEPPILSITYPYYGEVIRSPAVTISWEGADYASGVNHYTIAIDDEYSINVGLNASYTFTELDDGPHTVRIAAFDNAGNTIYQSLNFTVNAGVRFALPHYIVEAAGTVVIVIALGITIYVLKSRLSFRIRKPSRKLVR